MDISAYQHMNIRMSTRGKRPLRNLTPSDKVRAIQRIHNGETKASVSRDIGVPESTLRGWCKNEQKLRFMCRQLGAADQLPVIPGIENPPEKRSRFDNHLQSPQQYTTAANFEEFGYNRLPLNGLSFPSNGSNAILEKIALNEIMKKHMMSVDSATKQPAENLAAQMSGMVGNSIPITGDFNSQLSLMQNLNLLSLLSPNLSAMSNLNANGNETYDAVKNKTPQRATDAEMDNPNSNSNANNNTNNSKNNSLNAAASLSVKNWAKDPAEKSLLNFTNQTNINNSPAAAATNINHIGINHINNDSNNNNVNDKISAFPVDASLEAVNFPTPLPLSLLQIPKINNACDTPNNNIGNNNNNNTALLEWCKVFNASLNFLALAAAAAALQPNGSAATAKSVKKEDNILYKELTKTANLFDSAHHSTSFASSDLSNDSYFESEPEDLSVRSTATSKLSSPANSRPGSPNKSNASCSPLQSDGEH